MTYNISIFIVYFLEMLITYSFFFQICELKHKSIYCLLTGLALFELGAVINIFLNNTILINVSYFLIINTVFAITFFKIKLKKAIFYSVILNILNGALEFATIFLISAVTKTETNEYLTQMGLLIIEAVISKTLYFLTCLILARFVTKEKAEIKFPIGLYFYPAIVVVALLVFWSICSVTNIPNRHQIALSVVSMALFFSIIILFISYQHNIEKENSFFALQNKLEKIETDKTYYNILEKQNENLMIYAHDAKKHLAAISKLNTNPELDKYIGEMSDRLKAYSSTCHSGNHTLDVIIDKYVTQCEINNIRFTFDVHLANFKYTDDYDLVSILSNLLDNALEAAISSDKKEITLLTDHINTYDVLTITNSCSGPPEHREKHLRTTKSNKQIHGLGIKSVKKALKEYNGDFEWEYDESSKMFTATVLLYSEKQNNFTNTAEV